MDEFLYSDRDTLFADLTQDVVNALNAGIARRGAATLVLSGGGTPKPLFERLAVADLAWDKVTVTLADERWVPADHADSNERMLREILLRDRAAAATFVGLKTQHDTPLDGQVECSARIDELERPFDFVLLGMGTDGHTASLFPDGDQLGAALDPTQQASCLAIQAPGAAQPRMTLTYAALRNAHKLVLLCTGAAKRDVFAQAKAGDDVAAMPIRAFLKDPLHYYWAP